MTTTTHTYTLSGVRKAGLTCAGLLVAWLSITSFGDSSSLDMLVRDSSFVDGCETPPPAITGVSFDLCARSAKICHRRDVVSAVYLSSGVIEGRGGRTQPRPPQCTRDYR